MTTERKLKIILGTLSIGLLTTLIIKFIKAPGGITLSGFYLGGIMVATIFIGCLLLSALLRIVFKRITFLTLFLISTSVSYSLLHYQLYSPTLTIIVPSGFRGEINLVLSNVDDNILRVDRNGIGYLNKWTFDKTYSRPIVKEDDGKCLDSLLIGFNQSTFFGKATACCLGKQEIHSLSFKLGTKPNLKDEYFQGNSLIDHVDKRKIVFTDLRKHSTVTEANANLNRQ
jgi:hypothetical protein